jgi:hypothetical protein
MPPLAGVEPKPAARPSPASLRVLPSPAVRRAVRGKCKDRLFEDLPPKRGSVGKGAPMACAMVYWGENVKRFYDVFIEHGAVVDISNLIGEKIGLDRREPSLAKRRSADEVGRIQNDWRRDTAERMKKVAAALDVDLDDLT